ncbi:sporulation protein YpjB [Robertmurraya sp. DFI.2.37]|uniref:sporulation protein YpjB n=1 Tax=Robertmurraya sp. DFI.2.37 TaxID=3031819 RepID=UPI001246AE3D|nr:sporulation protein YpjB [Robertmurraya sp. DFI.2.37]MDF1507739.1 sporulation protein YpjB [Robertmurraya sp. DFI.2.37]
MKLKAAIFFIVILIVAPVTIQANHHISSIEKLDQISDEALQLVKSSRYDDAKKLLEYFSNEFLAYTMENHGFSIDELRIVTLAQNEAIEAMGNGSMDHDERINRVTKFRLAIDAITSTNQPLWTEMERPMMAVFGGMKDAALQGDAANFHSHLNSFLSLYEVIYPSMKLDVPVQRVQQIDARIHFIDEYRPQVLAEETGLQELVALETDLRDLFNQMSEDEADPSLWWVIITTGSIIIVTLSYVGWRKYRGDKERERAKKRM